MSGAQSIPTRRATWTAAGLPRVALTPAPACYAPGRQNRPRHGRAPCRRRGPVGAAPDDVLVAHVRRVLEASPFHGENSTRKVWAKKTGCRKSPLWKTRSADDPAAGYTRPSHDPGSRHALGRIASSASWAAAGWASSTRRTICWPRGSASGGGAAFRPSPPSTPWRRGISMTTLFGASGRSIPPADASRI